MNDISSFSEGELKQKINVLRQQIDSKEREIKVIFKEINLHNKGANEFRTKRDEFNKQVREFRENANEHRNKRDTVNKKIAELKKQKDEMRGRQSSYTDKIGELKKTRDDLNKIARGRIDFLNKTYAEQLNKFTTLDIPLEYEQSLFNSLIELGKRFEAIAKANTIHDEMGDVYGKVHEFKHELDTISALIRDMAGESQEHHESMMMTYADLDEIKGKSDEYHRQLVEIYKITRPLKDKIDVLKKSLSESRKELELYLEKLKDVQLDKDQVKNDEKRIEAKDKFQKSGRLSLEDLRLLMENDEITFDK